MNAKAAVTKCHEAISKSFIVLEKTPKGAEHPSATDVGAGAQRGTATRRWLSAAPVIREDVRGSSIIQNVLTKSC